MGPRKAAALAVVALCGGLLWVIVGHWLLVLGLTGAAMAGLVVATAWREAGRLAPWRQHRWSFGGPRRHLIRSDFAEYFGLDRAAATGAALALHGAVSENGVEQEPARVTRVPIAAGTGTLFLHLVDVELARKPSVRLVEKAVQSTSREAWFWREAGASQLPLTGPAYRAVAPIHQVAAAPVSILHFPYLAERGMTGPERRVSYLQPRPEIIPALALLNGRSGGWAPGNAGLQQLPFQVRRRRPAAPELARYLDVPREQARTLRRQWDATESGLPLVWEAYERLPTSLCHHDASPGNIRHHDGVTWLFDFGLFSLGAIGSDMHCVLRWSRDALADEQVADQLLADYLAGLPPEAPALTLDDVRLAAWTVFYLRYTDLDFGRMGRPAGNAGFLRRTGFQVALREMSRLVTRCAADGERNAVDAPDRTAVRQREPEPASEAPHR